MTTKRLGEAAQAAATAPDERHVEVQPRDHGAKFPDDLPPNTPWSFNVVPAYVLLKIHECVSGRSPWPLFFYGEPGSGKTCAAVWMANTYGGWYIELDAMCEKWNAATFQRLQWESGYPRTCQELRSDWEGCSIGILDEVGLSLDNEVKTAHMKTLKWCMDRRYGKPLVLVSNLGRTALARLYSDRISSRISAGTIVEFKGDMRCMAKITQ